MAGVCKQKQMMLLWITIFNAVTKFLQRNMPLSNKNKALINNLYQFKKYGLQRILTKFSKTNCKKKIGHFSKKIWEMRSTNQRHEAADQTACITEENETTMYELLGLLSQKNQKQMYLSTHLIPKKWF